MKKVVIVGGGIAGLSAGIFGRLHGFDTTIYEMHSIPGGECTGWNRKGYHFDNCIHWLTGTKENTDVYKVWETVGAFEDTKLYTAEYFMADCRAEQSVYFYKDLGRLEEEFMRIAPEDEVLIKSFIEDIKAAQQSGMPTKKIMSEMNVIDFMEQMKVYRPILGKMKEWNSLSVAEYAEKFKNPTLKEAIKGLLYNECPIANVFFMLGTYTSGNGGWPMGGSLAMVMRIAKRYKELGGLIQYKTKVSEIIVEDQKAVGIKLANGESIRADYVISAGDGMMLFKKLLGNRVVDKKLSTYAQKKEDYVFPITVDVGLGIKVDLSHRPHQAQYRVEPFKCGGDTVYSIGIKHYCIEKDFAPEGCSSVRIGMQVTDHRYWQELKLQNPQEYEHEKENIVKALVERLEQIYPETKGLIEVADVCTPATYESYCDAYNGCWMTPLPKVGSKIIQHPGKVKGIKNLLVAGQWVMSIGGLPTAVVSGKWAIQAICKQEKIKFKFKF